MYLISVAIWAAVSTASSRFRCDAPKTGAAGIDTIRRSEWLVD